MTVLTFPTITDDDGTGKSGTVVNKAWADAVEADIESRIHSATNPTLDGKDITDEMVNLRGNKASADARISGVIDDDGALIAPASIVNSSQLQSQAGAGHNLCRNSTFFLWSAGLTSAPDYWALTGSPTITITGTNETDTRRKIGEKAFKLTYGAVAGYLDQLILNSTAFTKLDHLKGETKKISFGGWVYATIANHASIIIGDGVGEEEVFHTGTEGWEFLGGVRAISGSATELKIRCKVAATGSAYFSGLTASFGDFAPTLWVPERIIRGQAMLEFVGSQVNGDGKKYLHFGRPLRVDNFQAFAVTGPVTSSFDIDVEKRESSGWQSMVTAGEIIADGDEIGDMQTTGDYNNRCLSGLFLGSGSGLPSGLGNKLMRINLDDVGSGTSVADVFMRMDAIQCIHPFEDQLAYNFLGV